MWRRQNESLRCRMRLESAGAVPLVPITFSRSRSRCNPRGTPGYTCWDVTLERSDRGIHAAPHVRAQVVRRAAEGSLYGTLAA